MERELLRKVQLTQLEIAKEIRRVCEENDIPYFLTCGTLLGAVRHQGFIPLGRRYGRGNAAGEL